MQALVPILVIALIGICALFFFLFYTPAAQKWRNREAVTPEPDEIVTHSDTPWQEAEAKAEAVEAQQDRQIPASR
jgi:hypothetical protein